MSPSDVNAKTKRERGVLAQREYRKRHASKVQKLQDENQKLKDIIGDIDRALGTGGAALPEDLRAALTKARDIAGIAKPDATSQDEPQELDTSSQSQEEDPPRQQDPPDIPAAERSQLVRSGCISPRLDYGLWLDADRLVRVIEPPVDIIPYLGPLADTLAGCIFWSTMHYTTDLWNSRGSTAPHSHSSKQHLDRMFNHSAHLSDRQFLMSLAQARVDYRRKGYMYRKLSEQFERNAMTELYERVRTEYERKGQPSRWWKRPEEVADAVLGLLTPNLRARFEAVVEGGGEEEDKELVRPLIQWLAQNFICFGDGPRWSSVFVSVGIGSWVNEVKRREGITE